jgi:hypothetical protein
LSAIQTNPTYNFQSKSSSIFQSQQTWPLLSWNIFTSNTGSTLSSSNLHSLEKSSCVFKYHLQTWWLPKSVLHWPLPWAPTAQICISNCLLKKHLMSQSA